MEGDFDSSIIIDDKEYLPVCKTSDVLSKRGICIEVNEDVSIALFKIDNSCYAVSNICPHQHQPVISAGIIEGTMITCPMHGWQFDICNGLPSSANKGSATLQTFPVVEQNGIVYVHVAEQPKPKWMME